MSINIYSEKKIDKLLEFLLDMDFESYLIIFSIIILMIFGIVTVNTEIYSDDYTELLRYTELSELELIEHYFQDGKITFYEKTQIDYLVQDNIENNVRVDFLKKFEGRK